MKNKKLIEMVCEGNSSRSELARLIGNKYLKENGLENYQINSSGIYVSLPATERIVKYSLEDLSSLINVGLDEGFYNQEDASKIENHLLKGDEKNLSKYFLKAGKQFQELEDFYREKARNELGITEDFKEMIEQTKVNPSNVAVLTMDKNSRNVVRNIYNKSNYSPIIETLGEFSTGNYDSEITNKIIDNSFEKTYENFIEKLKDYIPKAISKLGEY